MAEKIVRPFGPLKIILFGSYARGQAGENSDRDLLVVMDAPGPRGRRSAPIIRMLAEEYALPVEVIVRSAGGLERWKHVRGSLSGRVAADGIVLHERPKR